MYATRVNSHRMYVATKAIPPRWKYLQNLNIRDQGEECSRIKKNIKKRLCNDKMQEIIDSLPCDCDLVNDLDYMVSMRDPKNMQLWERIYVRNFVLRYVNLHGENEDIIHLLEYVLEFYGCNK